MQYNTLPRRTVHSTFTLATTIVVYHVVRRIVQYITAHYFRAQYSTLLSRKVQNITHCLGAQYSTLGAQFKLAVQIYLVA